MNSVIVDKNVLVYIYSDIPNIGRKCAELLGDLSTKYNLVILNLVYGELSLIYRLILRKIGTLTDTDKKAVAKALQRLLASRMEAGK